MPGHNREKVSWHQLYGSASGVAITQAALHHTAPLLVIVEDNAALHRIEEEIRFYCGEEAIPLFSFPDQEMLPYDRLSPHPDIISERLEVMRTLPTLRHGVVLSALHTLLQRLPPQAYVHAHAFRLDVGERVDRESLRLRLEQGGYHSVSQVMEHGEYAFRGAIIDLFPMGAERPFRIDLFDDEVESLRLFDPESQLTLSAVESIDLLPAREFPLTDESIRHFRQSWRQRFEGDPQQCPIYRDLSQGLIPAGIEFYLPLFFDHCDSLFDYLPPDTTIITTDGIRPQGERYWLELQGRYQEQTHDPQRPVLAPETLFLTLDSFGEQLDRHPEIELSSFKSDHDGSGLAHNLGSGKPMQLGLSGRLEQPLQPLVELIQRGPGRLLLVAESPGRRQALLEMLGPYQLFPKVVSSWSQFLAQPDIPFAITTAPLTEGLVLERGESDDLIVITETQLFGQQVLQQRRRRRRSGGDHVIHHLSELQIGSPVVHLDHGIGRYRGLVTLAAGGEIAEYLLLEYSRGEKLYVPVTALHLIARYTGVDPDKAPLHRLGSDQWSKARKRAAEQVRDVAAELLEIYARRAAREGFAMPPPDIEYHQFTNQFPFEETPDQAEAIEAVIGDLQQPQPMDRLVCGDVGFGKTEVAMRAAFLAVQGGRQVAVLVPTTLLAQQHYDNFCDRFADWPIRIEVLSRFRTGQQSTTALTQIANGKIDIVVGTHKLLQKSIRFHNLGMVIIDEEHRFGVRQKEQLKKLRAEVDILTLTATPIPRTLNMSMSGLRDLSIIATPPSNRVAIKTFVREWDPAMIREACLREIHRGGQVYFLHNKVETIEQRARELAELIPEATIEVAHGQMREQALEQVMSAFYHRRFNLLVCTTIIETGIDIPTANTIIMDRADRLGLAQLYQLRGRVGRSHHRAYAYLIIPGRNLVSSDAIKRLEAIESLEELGAGFTLAVHDMEIRGAGELLGDDQSGRMQEVGFELYAEMLERAVEDLRQGTESDLEQSPGAQIEVNLGLPMLLPEDYLPDVNARLVLYKRIAAAADRNALGELQVEIIDRFGPLPDSTQALLQATRLKLFAAPLGVTKIDAGEEGIQIEVGDRHQLDPDKIIARLQRQPDRFRLKGQHRIEWSGSLESIAQRLERAESLLSELQVKE